MLFLAIVAVAAGSVLYWTKSWLTHAVMDSLLKPEWKEWLLDKIWFLIIWDILMGISIAGVTSTAGGTTAMLITITFGGWSVFYIKTRKIRKAVKRGYHKTVDTVKGWMPA